MKQRFINSLKYPEESLRYYLSNLSDEDYKFKKPLYVKTFFKLLKNPSKLFIKKDFNQVVSEIFPDKKTLELENKLEIIDKKSLPDSIEFKKFKPLVSIVIPVFNQFEYTYTCLYSILKNTQDIDYEVIIADDCSTDETINISEKVKNIKISKTDENLGFLRNANKAAKLAEGKYICFLNNDTQVQPDWLYWLLKLFQEEEKVGVVGSKMVYSENCLQEAGSLVYKDDCVFQGRLDDPEKSAYSYVKEVDYLSGCSILLGRALFEEIGGFSEIYVPAYSEDSDLSFEIKKRGYKVLYQPKSVVLHHETISYSKNKWDLIKAHREIFNKKWEKELAMKTDFNKSKHPYSGELRPKTIVVIDDRLPEYDQHAGGKTIFHFLKLYKKMGLHVKFLPCDFYRNEPYATILGQMGIEVLVDKTLQSKADFDKWLFENSQMVDYVLVSRPQMAREYLPIVKKYSGIKVVYYGHDLHYLRLLREFELTGKQSLLEESKIFKKLEETVWKLSDAVYYPSQVEADIIKNEHPQINAKAIPAYLYEHSELKESNQEKKDLMFIGGFNHTPNRDGILWFIREIFPKILEKKPDMKIFILGTNPSEEIKNLECENIKVLGYVDDEALDNFYKNTKIVVAPLRFGAGVKGKIVEAIYKQVPVVTTSIGAEGIDNQDGVLTVADSEDDFANEVIRLYNDEEKYRQIVENSSKIIEKQFSYEKAMEIFSEDIDSSLRENKLIEDYFKCL